MLEPSLKNAKINENFQFLRQGYFVLDKDSNGEHIVFNRTVSLRDTWAKLKKKMGK
jgi:glutaminyl-tRNA synthetase